MFKRYTIEVNNHFLAFGYAPKEFGSEGVDEVVPVGVQHFHDKRCAADVEFDVDGDDECAAVECQAVGVGA